MLLIGSHALHHWHPDTREPADTNLWIPREDAERELTLLGIEHIQDCVRQRSARVLLGNGSPATVEFYSPESAEEKFVESNDNFHRIQVGQTEAAVADPATLLSIKRSLLYYPITGWEKHMADYHQLKDMLCNGDGEAYEALKPVRDQFVAQLQQRFGKYFNGATKSLKMKNEEFFGSYEKATIRLFEHDDLHTATKYYERPLYEMMKDDVSLAYVPRKNFDRLPKDDQLRVVREEAYAIALERVVIPSREFGLPYDADDAFRFALRRICTNLTRGWFREAAIETYPEVAAYDTDYVSRFDAAVGSGLITRKREQWNPDEEAWMEHYFTVYRDEWEYV